MSAANLHREVQQTYTKKHSISRRLRTTKGIARVHIDSSGTLYSTRHQRAFIKGVELRASTSLH